MTWNYRIVKVKDPEWSHNNGIKYGICEVYYNENGKPYARTEDSMIDWYDSEEEMLHDLELMLKDAKKGILEDKDLKGLSEHLNSLNIKEEELEEWT